MMSKRADKHHCGAVLQPPVQSCDCSNKNWLTGCYDVQVLHWSGQDAAAPHLAKSSSRGRKPWRSLSHAAKCQLMFAADQMDWSFIATLVQVMHRSSCICNQLSIVVACLLPTRTDNCHFMP